MAGDWIKMRLSLQTHPKIVRILSATKSDKFRAIGGLHAVWSVFDTHSVDGKLDGYTPETLDHIIGWDGFAQALISVGWLAKDGGDALVLPDFDEHNGASGKRRAEDQKRKRDARKGPKCVPDDCGQNADGMRTREEKRREEDTSLSDADAPDGEDMEVLKIERRKVRRGSDADYECAEFLFKQQRKANPSCKAPNFDTWANEIRLMREQDGRQHRDICELYKWAKADDFWSPNIQSPAKLREKWDVLHERRTRETPAAPTVKKDWL